MERQHVVQVVHQKRPHKNITNNWRRLWQFYFAKMNATQLCVTISPNEIPHQKKFCCRLICSVVSVECYCHVVCVCGMATNASARSSSNAYSKIWHKNHIYYLHCCVFNFSVNFIRWQIGKFVRLIDFIIGQMLHLDHLFPENNKMKTCLKVDKLQTFLFLFLCFWFRHQRPWFVKYTIAEKKSAPERTKKISFPLTVENEKGLIFISLFLTSCNKSNFVPTRWALNKSIEKMLWFFCRLS